MNERDGKSLVRRIERQEGKAEVFSSKTKHQAGCLFFSVSLPVGQHVCCSR